MNRSVGLILAIKAVDGQYEFARRLGIPEAAVAQWTKIPSHQIIPVEKATGVSRRLLRPDLYDDETILTGLMDETGPTGRVQPRRDLDDADPCSEKPK